MIVLSPYFVCFFILFYWSNQVFLNTTNLSVGELWLSRLWAEYLIIFETVWSGIQSNPSFLRGHLLQTKRMSAIIDGEGRYCDCLLALYLYTLYRLANDNGLRSRSLPCVIIQLFSSWAEMATISDRAVPNVQSERKKEAVYRIVFCLFITHSLTANS